MICQRRPDHGVPRTALDMRVAEALRRCFAILAFSVQEKFNLTESEFNRLKIFSPDKRLGTPLS